MDMHPLVPDEENANATPTCSSISACPALETGLCPRRVLSLLTVRILVSRERTRRLLLASRPRHKAKISVCNGTACAPRRGVAHVWRAEYLRPFTKHHTDFSTRFYSRRVRSVCSGVRHEDRHAAAPRGGTLKRARRLAVGVAASRGERVARSAAPPDRSQYARF